VSTVFRTYASISNRTIARKFSIGGLCVSAGRALFLWGGLTFQKLTKTYSVYSVSCFNLGGLKLCLGRLNPQKPSWRRDCFPGLYKILFEKNSLHLKYDALYQALFYIGIIMISIFFYWQSQDRTQLKFSRGDKVIVTCCCT